MSSVVGSGPIHDFYFDVYGDRWHVWGVADAAGHVAWGGAENLNAVVPDLANADANHGKGTPGLGPFEVSTPPTT